VLRFEDVSFGYGEERTVKHVSFHIKPGEFAALLGENGAGKSTLCRLCNGLCRPLSGRVLVGGQDTRQVKTSELARSIGFLFQNPDRQLCCSTVEEEIRFGLDQVLAGGGGKRVPRKGEAAARLREEVDARCREILALFSLDGSRDPFGLSRGERQQTALASVLARRPPLLILDEPTTGLDYRECMTILGIIQDLHRKGTTILMITHDMEVAGDFAERALVLSKGELIGDGPVKRVLKDPALLERASLLPAQIPALALSLGEGFEEVYTIDEMAAAAEKWRREKKT
jgi:energy-coupling factor transport system ATP-binding protein